VDAARVVREVADLLAETAAAKGLALVVEPGPIPHFRGDSGRLRQVLFNLVGNAIKFTPAGGVAIRAWLEPSEELGQAVRFEVHDTGIGIAQDHHEVIFEVFAQADDSTTRRFGGTGLGLAIARELVIRMGGEMAVSSAPGAGSVFAFWLPFLPVEWAAAASGAGAQRTAESSLRDGAFRVLLAEDNPVNQKVAVRYLERLGLRVDTVGDGAAAVASLATGGYDLVLMDCHMPDMDGYEATAKLRAAERESGRSRVPVIALTANAMVGDKERCLASEMDDYLPKPFKSGDLEHMLRRWLLDAAA